MALTTVDFKVTFQLGISTPEFEIEDLTDYISQGVAEADATGIFSIVDPTGATIYTGNFGSPDVDVDVSRIDVANVPIPLTAGGTPILGNYVITYTGQDAATGPDQASEVKTFNLQYTSPVVDLQLTVDCITPELASLDATGYVVGGVTPTIVRDHKIFFPAALELPSLDGTAQTVSTDTFYTTQHQSKLTSTLIYDFATDFAVTDIIVGSETIDVTCDAKLCDIYCCLKAEFDRWQSFRTTNKTMAKIHLDNFVQMTSHAETLRIALECSKTADVDAYVAEILRLGNCQPGCGCIDGEPVPVVGLSGTSGGNIVVDSGGAPVQVTSITVGNTTTYTVTIDSVFVTKVNNSFNTTLTAGTGTTITPTVAPSGDIDYLIDVDPVDQVDLLSFNVTVTVNDATLPTIALSDINLKGEAFTDSGITIVPSIVSSFADWQAGNVGFTLADFWDTQGGLEYKPHIDITSIRASSVSLFYGSDPGELLGFEAQRIAEADIVESRTDEMDFSIHLPGGQRLTGTGLQFASSEIKFSITLTA
jgi:hypothetical protein